MHTNSHKSIAHFVSYKNPENSVFITLTPPTGPELPSMAPLTEKNVAALFLDAVAADPAQALSFISKHYIGALDLDALRDVLGGGQICRRILKASYSSDPKNCLTRSILVTDKKGGVKRLLHLHMVKEPDRYGPWKIYGVEQE
jgi:hypothetical protein